MDTLTLSYYLGAFGSLHRNENKKLGVAPHKPVLLLAVLDEIERGAISQNLIELTPELAAAFRVYWRVLVPEGTWLERIANPFRFMVQDGFWTLVRDGIPVPTEELGNNPTLTQLTTEIDGAQLAPDLYQLLQHPSNVTTFRAHLLKTYFGLGTQQIQPALPASPIDYEIIRLKAEAKSRFKTVTRETPNETGYYIRHALFTKVIKSLYADTCAVCSLRVKTEQGSSIVDAAHIMPFYLFHNDDPRNGVALCKNHHWAFDNGGFAISQQYRVLPSPHLDYPASFLPAGAPLKLPDTAEHAPAFEALKWHRDNRYKP